MRTTVMKLMLGRVGWALPLVLVAAIALYAMPASAAPFAYVANQVSNTVSVIDTATNTVVDSVPVGSLPWGVAITPDGAFAYVTNGSSNTVSVIDTATHTVVATISVGSVPRGVAITPDGTSVYVTNNSYSSSPSTVSVIDVATNTLTATIPVGSTPRGVAITPNGAFAYVANYGSNTISVIATATNTVLGAIPVGVSPMGVAITPNGAFAYVANYGSHTVSVIAMATNTVVATIPVPGWPPVSVAITPDGAFAYVVNTCNAVSNCNNATVSVIDVATNTLTATIPVGSYPWGVAITPNGAFAYVANYASDTVSVIATATNAVVATVRVGVGPVWVAFTPTNLAQTCVQPPLGLIGWWPGDGNADDIVGTNNGTVVGNTTFTTGVVDQAFNFPGSSTVESHVAVADSPELQLTGPLSLDAWLSFSGVAPQTPGASNAPIVAKWGADIFGTAGYGLFVRADGTLIFEVSPDGSAKVAVLSPSPLPTGTFVHVAGVYTGTQLGLYVDGVQVNTASFSGAINGNNGVPLAIGGYITPYTNVNDSIVGVIDEVEILDRALSDAEIQAIYNAGTAGKCKADTTPPVITAAATTAANGNGWYNSNVTVHFTCSDAGSGIAPGACPADEILSAEGSSVSSTAQTVTDRAGNTSAPSNVVTAKIDKTPPTITGSASPAANANGWNNSAVTVSFACNDATSGIATCAAAQTLAGEGANQSVSGTATDNAGNSASTQVTGINVDLTAPVVSVTGVSNGATYTLGSVPAAGCVTTDALSGVQTSATLSVTGGNSNGTGTFTASCTGAMDKAGNPGTAASVTYQVNAAPPSACSTFSTFGVNLLGIDQRLKTFFLLSNFTLGQDSNGIAPVKDTVKLTIANLTTTIPAGSFRKGPAGVYAFAGKINNVSIEALLTPLGSNRFGFQTAAYGANLSGTKNPVTVGLTIGDDCGTTSVNAIIK